MEADGHGIAFDAQPADCRRADNPQDGLEHGDSRRADRQIDARTLLAQLVDVARVAQHGFAVAADQQIAVVAREAGQIRDIGEIGDQQGIDARFSEQSAEPAASGLKIHDGGRGQGPEVRGQKAACGFASGPAVHQLDQAGGRLARAWRR